MAELNKFLKLINHPETIIWSKVLILLTNRSMSILPLCTSNIKLFMYVNNSQHYLYFYVN